MALSVPPVDIHMYYFAALALLAASCDWRVIEAGSTAAAVHPIVLNFALPSLIYPGSSNLLCLTRRQSFS